MSAAVMAASHGIAKLRTPLGIVLGLAASLVVHPLLDGGGTTLPVAERQTVVLSDCDGRLRELVIHYVPEAVDIVTPVYRDFLRKLPKDVQVHVVCPSDAAFSDFSRNVAPVACVLTPVVVDHPITTWSRDRWLALATADTATADTATADTATADTATAETMVTTLLSPRGEKNASIWPARAGDEQVGGDLSAALAGVVAGRSHLFFDGGDFVADSETVFVTPDVLLRNLQFTVPTRNELVQQLSHALGREVVLLEDAPQHHAGMYMMPVGNRTMLVGDPSLAKELLEDSPSDSVASLCGPHGPDFTQPTIDRFDAVAQQCRAAGYRVVRIPIVPGRDGRTYLTWLNGVLDEPDALDKNSPLDAPNERRVVYMPVFDEAGELNDSARHVWESLGYEVRTVDCSTSFHHSGSLRCLVNVLKRG